MSHMFVPLYSPYPNLFDEFRLNFILEVYPKKNLSD
jgi:hypothetical protein